MRFNSAVDSWFYWVLVFITITLLVALVPSFKAGQISAIYVFCLAIFSLGLPIWLLYSTYYEVVGGNLKIKSGPFTWNLKIDEIQSAKPSRNMMSSPALSLNRIELIYDRGRRILVSPKDRDGFFKAIGYDQSAT